MFSDALPGAKPSATTTDVIVTLLSPESYCMSQEAWHWYKPLIKQWSWLPRTSTTCWFNYLMVHLLTAKKDLCVNTENPLISPTVCQKEDLMVNIIPNILTDVGTTKADECKSRNICRISRCWLGGVKTFGWGVCAAVAMMLQLELSGSCPMPTSCRPVACSTIPNCSPIGIGTKLL